MVSEKPTESKKTKNKQMYYYYYYLEQGTGKLIINITFKEKDGEPVSLRQFTDFLDSINTIHQYILLLTQPEYKKDLSAIENIENITFLSYHQLEIEKIRRENPFFLTLSLRIAADGIINYWTYWEILISICKRYGKSTDELAKTIEIVLMGLSKISGSIKQLILNSKLREILGDNLEEDYLGNMINEIEKSIIKLLKNPKFSKIYNSFCTTSIVITEAISYFNFDKVEDFGNLVQSISNEKIKLI